jgi:nitrite reductase (NADH) small subunit
VTHEPARDLTDSDLPVELAAAVERLDGLVKRFEEHPDPAVKDRVFELLTCIDAVHRVGLRRLNELLKVAGLQKRAVDDPEVRLLFDMYDLGEGGEETRMAAMVESVRPGLAEMGVQIEIVTATPTALAVRLIYPPRADPAGLEALQSSLQAVLFEGLPGVQRVTVELATLPPALQNNFVPIGELKLPPKIDWQPVMGLAELPDLSVRAIQLNSERVLLAHLDGDEVYAYRNCCPETPFPLEAGQVSGTLLRCPWHGCTFDLRGGRRVDQSAPGLGVIPSRVQDGQIYVGLPHAAVTP